MINIVGMFDEFGSKMRMMIIINSINMFMQYCIDEKLEPSVTGMTDFIKDKTGIEVDNEYLEVALKLVIGNLNLFIMFTINEAAEKIAEDMLDNPSNIKEVLKRVI